MKAITVTSENKINNQLANKEIGAHVRFSEVPKKWIFEGLKYFDFDTRKDENNVLLSYKAGFRNLVVEQLSETQRSGLIDWVEADDQFIIPAVNLSQQEIDDRIEASEENEAESQLQNHIQSGNDLFNKCYKKIWRRRNKSANQANKLTQSQARSLMEWFDPIYNHLRNGNFHQANKWVGRLYEINSIKTAEGIVIDGVPGMLDTYQWFASEITTYFNNQYDL